MAERILIVSNKDIDLKLIRRIIDSNRFDIVAYTPSHDIKKLIFSGDFAAILADYDFVEDRVVEWIDILQITKSRSCLILYGDKCSTDNIAEILRKGAYGFIPRPLLEERIYTTLIDGLENRKAFIEILAMIDEQKNANERLEQEKLSLRKKNQELDFINRFSCEVAYDLSWKDILSKMIKAGFLNIIDSDIISVLYRIGNEWYFSCYLPGVLSDNSSVVKMEEDICDKFFSLTGERILTKEVSISVHSSDAKELSNIPSFSSDQLILPLIHRERPLGALVILPKNSILLKNKNSELLSTLLNILVMSLNNAQEYNKIKKMTIRDGLTGVYNQKGFKEFIECEFQKARRYKRPVSMIMIDVDNFKAINDSLGHLAGDYVLIELAKRLNNALRKTDILVRYGGDEFAIILPDTKMNEAEVLIDRILSSVKYDFFNWKCDNFLVEISYGIAVISELGLMDNANDLISLADYRLYNAKRRLHQYSPITCNGSLPVFGTYLAS